MLNICFTADHELFSGHNFSSENEIVIKPTYKLMKILEEFNIPLCLMTDVLSILKYKELKLDRDYTSLMEEQLCYAINTGHDVQLHIHPHWLTSDFSDGQWKFNFENFRLHSFGFNPKKTLSGQEIIARGKKYLVDLLTPIDQCYRCIAFRAGGWCLQPEKELLAALVSEEIMIDATVFYRGYHNNGTIYYDYRCVPDKPNWWINPQEGLSYEAMKGEGNILEVSIGSYGYLPMLALKKILFKLYRLRNLRCRVERGRGICLDDLNNSSMSTHIANKVRSFLFEPIILSFDAACMPVMMNLIKSYLRRFDCENQDFYISIIGHPKVLTKKSLEEIRKFCEVVTQKYSNIVRFIRFSDISF